MTSKGWRSGRDQPFLRNWDERGGIPDVKMRGYCQVCLRDRMASRAGRRFEARSGRERRIPAAWLGQQRLLVFRVCFHFSVF